MGDGATSPIADGAARRPSPPLRRYVAGYDGYRLAGPPGRHRGLPSPLLTLIITLDEPLVIAAHPDPSQPPGRFDALLGGLHARPAIVAHHGRQSGIQVGLHPLGARALLGLPAGEIAHVDVPLDDVLGPWTDAVRQRLLASPSWAGRFAVLDRAFEARVSAVAGAARREVPAEVHEAWTALVGRGPKAPVGALARALGWSPRRLLGQFRQEIGLAPAEAVRVARFDRARRRLFTRAAAGGPLRLADLAVAEGYYDQAHLARDFRDLAGCPPSRLVAEELRFVQAAPLGGTGGWGHDEHID